MKIKFLGAADHITGSCSLLEYSTGFQILVDCGLNQGASVEKINKQAFRFDPEKINCVLLTHAHLDHCGLIPKLYRHGYRGKVYATEATAKLAKLSLIDTARIQKADTGPIFEESDIELIDFVCIDNRKDFSWGKCIPITEGVKVSFLRSSHILGSTSISISWSDNPDSDDNKNKKTMLFSGDIGNNTESNSYLPLMKENQLPFFNSNYILVESTYGSRQRDKAYKCSKNRLEQLQKEFQETIYQNNGKVIIPSFTIHRFQEILIDIISLLRKDNNKRKLNVLFHSKMGLKVNKIFSKELFKEITNPKGKIKDQYLSEKITKHLGFENKENCKSFIKSIFKNTNYIKINGHQITFTDKPIDNIEHDIIITSSGMCDHGPIKHYLEKYLYNNHNKILITGYQSVGSYGYELLNNPENNENAKVVDFSSFYSGHADQSILLDYIFDLNNLLDNKIPASVFINHGETSSKNELKQLIENRTSEKKPEDRQIKSVRLAEQCEQWFDLEKEQYEENNEISYINRHEFIEIKSKLNELTLCINRLTKLVS